MVNKIIYICYLPLTKKLEQDFYIQDLIDSNYSVEYWDLSPIFFNDVSFSNEHDRDYVLKIDTYQYFQNCIKKEKNPRTVYIPMITYGYQSFRLYRILTKNKCKLYYFGRGCLPSAVNDFSLDSLYVKLYLLFDGKKAIRYFADKFALFMKKVKIVKNYDVVFAAGQIAENIHQKASMVIPVNHFDYDEYVRVKDDGGCLVKGKYCVFHDDNIVANTDYLILRQKTVKAHDYYNSVNRFFKYIEDQYNIKVVIAAHPNAKYEHETFAGREIYKFETCRLVQKCEFSIAHYSTSISYPVLFKKPVIFIYTSEMKNMFYFKTIKTFAKVLKQPLVNIDSSDTEKLTLKEVDIHNYEEYKLKYITSLNSKNEYTRDIFLTSLNRMMTRSD